MTFLISVKSTIDFQSKQIADAKSWSFGDLDSTDSYEAVMSEEGNCVVWEIGSFTEAPIDPLYDLEFFIGAKTVVDAGGYNSTSLLQDVLNSMAVGSSITVKDYSGAIASAETGLLFITSVEMEPQMFDKHAGIRMVRIAAKAQSYV